MTGTTIDWAMWAGAGVVALIALGLLAWSLFWDRSRGRRRCPRCWYRMEGVASGGGLMCPECGHGARSERALYRTRRRWRWTGAAVLLLLVAYGLAQTPRVRQKGWASAIPGPVLVTVWPLSVKKWIAARLDGEVIASAGLDELDRRIADDELAAWEASWWRDRVEQELRRQDRYGTLEEDVVLKKLREANISCSFVAEPLEDVIRGVAAQLGMVVETDWGSLQDANVTPDMRVSLEVSDVSGEVLLNRLMHAVSMDRFAAPQWWPRRVSDGGGVKIGSQQAAITSTRVISYDLGELLTAIQVEQKRLAPVPPPPLPGAAPGQAPTPPLPIGESMRFIIQAMVDTEGWIDVGGDRGAIARVGRFLVVKTTARDHARVAGMLDATSRSFAPSIDHSAHPPLAAEEEAWQQTQRTLQTLAGASLTLEEGWTRVEPFLAAAERVSGVRIRTEWEALDRVRVMPETSVATKRVTISTSHALTRVLDATGSDFLARTTWTVEGADVFVTSTDMLWRFTPVRIYDVSDVTASALATSRAGYSLPMAVSDLKDIIYRTVDPLGWIVNGGEQSAVFDIEYRLVVRTTLHNHLAIEDLLTKLRQGAIRREPTERPRPDEPSSEESAPEHDG